MTWARLDDRFPWHRKVRPLTDAAFRLHVSAVCWANEHLTDGRVATKELTLVSDIRVPRKAVRELVDAGLWDEVDGGWAIHDFLTYNESRATVMARREADAERKRRGRTSRWDAGTPPGQPSRSGPESGEDSTRNPDGIQAESDRPGPARPVPVVAAAREGTSPPRSQPAQNGGSGDRDYDAEALEILEHHGPWTAGVRRSLRRELTECLEAGASPVACDAGLAEWKTRERAMPGLLPHLVRDATRGGASDDPSMEWFRP